MPIRTRTWTCLVYMPPSVRRRLLICAVPRLPGICGLLMLCGTLPLRGLLPIRVVPCSSGRGLPSPVSVPRCLSWICSQCAASPVVRLLHLPCVCLVLQGALTSACRHIPHRISMATTNAQTAIAATLCGPPLTSACSFASSAQESTATLVGGCTLLFVVLMAP